jgi:hypothetical protein
MLGQDLEEKCTFSLSLHLLGCKREPKDEDGEQGGKLGVAVTTTPVLHCTEMHCQSCVSPHNEPKTMQCPLQLIGRMRAQIHPSHRGKSSRGRCVIRGVGSPTCGECPSTNSISIPSPSAVVFALLIGKSPVLGVFHGAIKYSQDSGSRG